jgi:hypothetical protein
MSLVVESALQETSVTPPPTSYDRGLGRIKAFDPRDHNFLRRASLPKAKPQRRKMYWIMPDNLDQGNTPQCVAYAWEHYLLASPVKNRMYKTPNELYHECQLVDEWEGVNYDGTSGRAGAKVLQQAGLIGKYEWAFDLDTMTRHLLDFGPVVIGTNWYEAMFEPNTQVGKDLFLRVDGEYAGGHEWVLDGCNLDGKCYCGDPGKYQGFNSWGNQWADSGRFWICPKDLARLIREDGEVCMATELRFQSAL